MTEKLSVGADLITQAAKLLEAIPRSSMGIIEVCFDADKEVIEVWDMQADEEQLLGMAVYD